MSFACLLPAFLMVALGASACAAKPKTEYIYGPLQDSNPRRSLPKPSFSLPQTKTDRENLEVLRRLDDVQRNVEYLKKETGEK